MGATEVLQVLYFFLPAYVANVTPVLVQGHVEWLDRPLDFGARLWGERLFGAHKTWRGLVCGMVAGAVVFAVQQAIHAAGGLQALALVDYDTQSVWLGVLLGLGTGVGDAVKSCAKRQLGIPPGGSWIGFDQLDFMVGAYVFALPLVEVPMLPFLLCLPIVFAGSLLTTATGYGLGLKESWI